jgi:exonuclease VII large subunit
MEKKTNILEFYRQQVKDGQEAVEQARKRYEKDKTVHAFSANRSELDRMENALAQDMSRLAVAEQIRKQTIDELRKNGHPISAESEIKSISMNIISAKKGALVFIPDEDSK